MVLALQFLTDMLDMAQVMTTLQQLPERRKILRASSFPSSENLLDNTTSQVLSRLNEGKSVAKAQIGDFDAILVVINKLRKDLSQQSSAVLQGALGEIQITCLVFPAEISPFRRQG